MCSAYVSNSQFRRMIEASAPDFWRLWYVGLIVATVRWLETVAVGIVVYQRTDSAFLVSMMTMLRLLPMGLFGVFLGALAERFDRGKTLLIVVLLMSGTSAVLAILDLTGRIEIWHLALASFINGCGWCTDNPVRRVMIGEVVGREQMGTAMSLDVGANKCKPHGGPRRRRIPARRNGHSGRLYSERADVLHRPMGDSDHPLAHSSCRGLRRRACADRRGARLCAYRQAAHRRAGCDGDLQYFRLALHQHDPRHWARPSAFGPRGVGLLATMDGIGAFVGALLVALWQTPRWYGRAYLCGVGCYLITVVIFALVQSPALAGAALLLTFTLDFGVTLDLVICVFPALLIGRDVCASSGHDACGQYPKE
ncbi:MAG: hypothetical protein QOG73_4549 [Acetobacteraceae bacterium]|nr:hypothetical protein [Acetobacteraceae bacterium]